MSIADITQMGHGAPPRNGKAGRRFAPAPGSGELLYLMQSGHQRPWPEINRVKIGVAIDVVARRAALQTGNPEVISVLKVWRHPRARTIEAAVLSACHMNVACGEWLNLHADHGVTIVEVVICSFEVVRCKEEILPDPYGGIFTRSIVTTATGKIFQCDFKSEGGHTTQENIARIMRERPHCWRLRLNGEFRRTDPPLKA